MTRRCMWHGMEVSTFSKLPQWDPPGTSTVQNLTAKKVFWCQILFGLQYIKMPTNLVPSVPITRDRGTQLFCNDQLQRAKIVPLGRTTLDDALWGFPYYSIQNTSGVLRTRLYMERHMSLPIEVRAQSYGDL
ncbi:hypothetical protein Tco_1103104 [Tanacetum coccineum]